MSETGYGSERSDFRQWGTDWFFRKEGKKKSISPSALKGIGCGAVLLFSAIQFANNSAAPAIGVHSESFAVPPMASTVHDEHRFPVAESLPRESTRREEKRSLRPVRLAAPQVIARPLNLASIPPGSLVRAILVSGASNGSVKAKLEEALTVNGDTLLETGTILVGQGNSTEERLMVSFRQAVFRDGTFGNVQADACDGADQIVGLKGTRIGIRTLNIAGSIGLGFVGGLSEGLKDKRGQQGVLVHPSTLKNALLNATSATALEQGHNLMSDLKHQKAIIEVPSGTPIWVLFGGGQ